jgi:hypothetical protein
MMSKQALTGLRTKAREAVGILLVRRNLALRSYSAQIRVAGLLPAPQPHLPVWGSESSLLTPES